MVIGRSSLSWLVLMAIGRSSLSLVGPQSHGHWKVIMVNGTSSWSLVGPHFRWYHDQW